MPLRCFDPGLYHYEISEPLDDRCIAPTREKERCRFEFRQTELDEINDLMLEAENERDRAARNEILRRIVLLRTCGQSHRKKLAEDSECLGVIAGKYGEMIRAARSGSSRRMQPRRRGTSSDESDFWSDGVERKPYYRLEPRGVTTSAVTTRSRSARVTQHLAPYRLGHSVRDKIKQYLPEDQAASGYVYAFTWSQCPGYVKIGFSRDLDRRLREWNECLPGVQLVTKVVTLFPKRMEELVHLELNEVRHEISMCQRCGRTTHNEFFKTSAENVKSVIYAWMEVLDRELLYDEFGNLTEDWRDRLSQYDRSLTAERLLRILDREEEQARLDELALEREEMARARARESRTRARDDDLSNAMARMQIAARSSRRY